MKTVTKVWIIAFLQWWNRN